MVPYTFDVAGDTAGLRVHFPQVLDFAIVVKAVLPAAVLCDRFFFSFGLDVLPERGGGETGGYDFLETSTLAVASAMSFAHLLHAGKNVFSGQSTRNVSTVCCLGPVRESARHRTMFVLKAAADCAALLSLPAHETWTRNDPCSCEIRSWH